MTYFLFVCDVYIQFHGNILSAEFVIQQVMKKYAEQVRDKARNGTGGDSVLFCNDRNKRTTLHTCTWPFFSGYAYITLILHTINYNDNN